MRTDKIKYLYTALLAICCCTASLKAQEIDPTVEVRRDYEASLMNITKPKLETLVNDSLYRFNLNFYYTTNSKPYKDLYEFSPIPFFEVSDVGSERLPIFFADFGFSYPTNPYASIYFQPVSKNMKNNFILYGSHDSEWKRLDGAVADLMDNQLGFALRHSWKKGELTFDARYDGDYKTYYGFYDRTGLENMALDSREFMSENFASYRNGASALLDVRSSHTDETSFDYDFLLKYRFTDIIPEIIGYNGLRSHDFAFSGFVGPTFARRHKIQIGFNSETSLYGNGCIYGLAEVKPTYKLNLKRWRFDLGLKVSIPYSGKQEESERLGGKRQIVFPDVHISVQAIRKAMLIYTEVTGGDRLNSISALTRQIRWIHPQYDVPSISTETVKAALGFKGSFKDRFWYNIYADYGILNNQLAVVNDASIIALLDPVYQNYSYAGAGLELRYRNRFLEFGLDARYRYFHHYENLPLLESPLKLGFHGEYTWRDRISARIDMGYEHDRTAAYRKGNETVYGQLDGFFNLGIYVSYRFSPYATLYIQGDNITNSKQYEFWGYRKKGINFGLGMYIKF